MIQKIITDTNNWVCSLHIRFALWLQIIDFVISLIDLWISDIVLHVSVVQCLISQIHFLSCAVCLSDVRIINSRLNCKMAIHTRARDTPMDNNGVRTNSIFGARKRNLVHVRKVLFDADGLGSLFSIPWATHFQGQTFHASSAYERTIFCSTVLISRCQLLQGNALRDGLAPPIK